MPSSFNSGEVKTKLVLISDSSPPILRLLTPLGLSIPIGSEPTVMGPSIFNGKLSAARVNHIYCKIISTGAATGAMMVLAWPASQDYPTELARDQRPKTRYISHRCHLSRPQRFT